MIKSMTGFGKGCVRGPLGTINVEIRTLNHKYFDISNRLPNHLSAFDEKVRELLKKKLKRGRVNLFSSWESNKKSKTTFSLDVNLAGRYHRQLLKLKRTLKLKDDLGVAQLLSLPDLITYEQEKENLSQVWPYLKKATTDALKKLERMRSAEGKRLSCDLSQRARKIRYYLDKIEKQLPKVIQRYRMNLLQKVKALSGARRLDQDKIAEEVALFVRSSDVAEELTRIKSHLKGFKSAMSTQKEAGKELDFIAQELFREANTIGAKASSFRISQWVIKIKSQIEKLREQLQNVE